MACLFMSALTDLKTSQPFAKLSSLNFLEKRIYGHTWEQLKNFVKYYVTNKFDMNLILPFIPRPMKSTDRTI